MVLVSYFSFLVLVSNILFVFLVFFYRRLKPLISLHAVDYAFIVATFSVIGSLIMSEILFLPPCTLCWYQRIFMYPLVPILVIAKLKKSKDINLVVLTLSVIGGCIALYHYFIQLFPGFAVTCSFATPCTEKLFIEYGYITIPWMSFTAFVWIGLMAAIGQAKS